MPFSKVYLSLHPVTQKAQTCQGITQRYSIANVTKIGQEMCVVHQLSFGRSYQEQRDGQGMWHVWRRCRQRFDRETWRTMITWKTQT